MRDRLRDRFLQLVPIDEIWGQEDEILRACEAVFDEAGLTHRRDDFGNLLAFIDGEGEPLFLSTHLDIPESVAALEWEEDGDVIRATGASILGADPKSGLAVLLELAIELAARRRSGERGNRPLDIVLTLGEEAGLYGATGLDTSLLRASMGLILDEDGPCTQVVTGASGYYRIDAEVIGATVHPRDWPDGVNALAPMCKALAAFPQGVIGDEVLFNVGILESGTARNSVPGKARMEAELRGFDTPSLVRWGERVAERIRREAEAAGAEARIEAFLEFEGYRVPPDHPLFQLLDRAYAAAGLTPNRYETHGASDANVLNERGLTCLPIGSAYYLAHRYDEYVKLSAMEELLRFLLVVSRVEL